MNKFIKKNMVLIIVLAATIAGVGILAFLVVKQHATMQAYIKQTEALKDKIKELIKQKPAPVEGNLARIKNDTEGYKKKFKETSVLFGKPFYPAAKKFAEEMGTTVDEFKEKLNTFWTSSKASGVTRDQMYRKFKADINNQEKWDKAIQSFTQEAQKYTSESIDENNVDEILLSSFGLARDFGGSKVKCDAFMKDIRYRLIELYGPDKDKDKEKKKTIDFGPTASSFSFDFKSLPERDSIPDIIKCWTIIDDLAKRIASSGVTCLDSFNKESLTGRVETNYTTYRFTIGVRGDLNSFRKLMENLYNAYSERRVYIVSGITLIKVRDEAEQLIAEAESKLYGNNLVDDDSSESKASSASARQPESAMAPPNRNQRPAFASPPGVPQIPGRELSGNIDGDPQRKKESDRESLDKKRKQEKLDKSKQADVDPDKDLPYYKRRSYGKIIIGSDKQCQAIIDVDYVVYTAQDLKQDSKE